MAFFWWFTFDRRLQTTWKFNLFFVVVVLPVTPRPPKHPRGGVPAVEAVTDAGLGIRSPLDRDGRPGLVGSRLQRD